MGCNHKRIHEWATTRGYTNGLCATLATEPQEDTRMGCAPPSHFEVVDLPPRVSSSSKIAVFGGERRRVGKGERGDRVVTVGYQYLGQCHLRTYGASKRAMIVNIPSENTRAFEFDRAASLELNVFADLGNNASNHAANVFTACNHLLCLKKTHTHPNQPNKNKNHQITLTYLSAPQA